jgi:hypothetical protein
VPYLRTWRRKLAARGRLAATATAAGMIVSVVAVSCTTAAPPSAATRAAHASGSRAAPGARLWVSRYDGPAGTSAWPTAVAVSQDGSAVFVTGWSRDHNAPAGYVTVGYDSATGGQLWARRYSGPGKTFDVAGGIAVSPDGRIVFVTGTSAAPHLVRTTPRSPTAHRRASNCGCAGMTDPMALPTPRPRS